MVDKMDWGVPDWHDQAAYPKDSDELTDIQWRWQFLRRRHDYRDAWKSEAASIAPIHPKGSPDQPEYRVVFIGDADVLFGLMGACPHPGWDDVPWQYLIFNDDYPKIFPGDIGQGGGALGALRETPQRDVGTISTTELAAVFDLTEPIPPQIKTVKSALRIYQELLDGTELRSGKKVKKERRRNRSKPLFPVYLRVLDAKDAGILPKVIGMEIGGKCDPDEARIWERDTLKRAKRVQIHGM